MDKNYRFFKKSQKKEDLNKNFNRLVLMNMETQKDIHGKDTSEKDLLIIKYDGPSFDNRMELHAFTKQIKAVEKVLRETVDTLNKSSKIKDTSKDSKYYLELRKGSFETVILVLFSNPICTNIVSDCIFEFFKYLVTKVKEDKYKNEITTLIENKNIRKSVRDIISPCNNSADKMILVTGDNSTVNILTEEKREIINKNLKEIEEKEPTERVEQELIGKIKNLIGKDKEEITESNLGFTIEGQTEVVDVIFENKPTEKELRDILFKRIRINCELLKRGEEIIKISIKSFELSPIKKVNEY